MVRVLVVVSRIWLGLRRGVSWGVMGAVVMRRVAAVVAVVVVVVVVVVV